MDEEAMKSIRKRLHVVCERLLRVHRGEVQQGLVDGEVKAINRELQNLRKLVASGGSNG